MFEGAKVSEFREGVWGNPFFRQKRGSPNGFQGQSPWWGPGAKPLVGGLEGKALQHLSGVADGFFGGFSAEAEADG